MSPQFAKGGLKIFSYEKGWGWIRVEGREADLFFHISQYLDSDELKPGTRLVFEIGPGSTGREQAVRVRLDRHTAVRLLSQPQDTTHSSPRRRPYNGKPTYRLKTGFFTWGACGAKIESKCLQCGGTGDVTAIDDHNIGFQCARCLRYWRQPNRGDNYINPDEVLREGDDVCPKCGNAAHRGSSDSDGLHFWCLCKHSWVKARS